MLLWCWMLQVCCLLPSYSYCLVQLPATGQAGARALRFSRYEYILKNRLSPLFISTVDWSTLEEDEDEDMLIDAARRQVEKDMNESRKPVQTENDTEDGEEEGEEEELEEVTEEEMEEAQRMAFGDNHYQTVNKLVVAALENKYDLENGVNPMSSRRSVSKVAPVKANIDLWQYYGRQSLLQGKFSEAMDFYLKCIEYDPSDGRGWLGKSRVEWKRRRRDESEVTLKEGLRNSPRNPFLMQSLADVLLKTGRLAESKKILQSSVSSNPTHAASWLSLASLCVRQGDMIAARQSFEKGIENCPRSYALYQGLGNLDLAEGKLDQSRDQFLTALSYSQRSSYGWHGLLNVELKAGKLFAAEDAADRGLQNVPDSSRLWQAKALIRLRMGDVDGARTVFQQGYKFAAKKGDGGYLQSWAMLEKKELELLRSQLTRYAMRKFNLENRKLLNSGDQQLYVFGNNLVPLKDNFADFEHSNKRSIEELNDFFRSPDNWLRFLQNSYSALTPNQCVELAEDMAVQKLKASIINQIKVTRDLLFGAALLNKFNLAVWTGWADLETSLGLVNVARKLLLTANSNSPHSKDISWIQGRFARVAIAEGDVETARACYGRSLSNCPPQKSFSILSEYVNMEIKFGTRKQIKPLVELGTRRFPKEEL